jgi:uncharacterized membrane protein
MTDQTGSSEPESAASASDVELIGAERLIFFSDAVVAIAITLLVLGLPPVLGLTNAAVLRSMRAATDAYLPFLISFVVIGAYWRAHHRLFQYVARLDSRLVTINMVWLLMIIISPYATRVLSGNGGFAVRFSFYAAIQVVTMITLVAMSRHIRDGRLLRPGAPRPSSTPDDIGALAVAACFAISIPIAFVTKWAYAVWVASALAARVVRRVRGS